MNFVFDNMYSQPRAVLFHKKNDTKNWTLDKMN